MHNSMQSMGKKYLFTALRVQKHHLSAIIARPHGKMNPNSTIAIPFDQEFIEVMLRLFRVVDKDGRIADSLLHSRGSDIHRTPRQVI